MLTIKVRNVNEALYRAVDLLRAKHDATMISPRGMQTIEWPTPVCTTYENPTERVLFSPTRDANPFFHFFEALWIIKGREDVKFLEHFNKRMRDYSDNGIKFHGAYGYRLRWHFDAADQIEAAIEHLHTHPASRRCVLQIWDNVVDLPKLKDGKDLPCNDLIFLKLRDGALNMTVCCRSNDVLWGAYGANAVHFSMLQEYIAGRMGVRVGQYHQISDSWHVYTGGPGGELWDALRSEAPGAGLEHNLYEYKNVTPFPMMGCYAPDFDTDLNTFFEAFDEGDITDLITEYRYQTPFFRFVVTPMYRAWHRHKEGRQHEALSAIDTCSAQDWQLAGREWLLRRHARKEVANG